MGICALYHNITDEVKNIWIKTVNRWKYFGCDCHCHNCCGGVIFEGQPYSQRGRDGYTSTRMDNVRMLTCPKCHGSKQSGKPCSMEGCPMYY